MMTLEMLDQAACWDSVCRRDPAADGSFFYAVITTGVFCRPSCAARQPRPENVRFYETTADAERAGYRACKRCRPTEDGNQIVEKVEALCAHIREHLDDRLTLQSLSEVSGWSPFHLQRSFKQVTGLSPRQYADACRLQVLKGQLQAGHSVTRAMNDAGYGSTSRLYERTDSQLGMTPIEYRRGGRGIAIKYLLTETVMGWLIVGATERGLCAVLLGDTPEEVLEELREEYPQADIAAAGPELQAWVSDIVKHLAGEHRELSLPLDVQATAFQWRVWEYLRSIPYGETRSYREVAVGIGQPSASRAVARACATNRVALAIPCHRVIRGDGDLGGYRWGIERKQRLLAVERLGDED